MIHYLKISTENFDNLPKGKNFEVRLNDRDYKVGDTLVLREYKECSASFSGFARREKISYVHKDFGMQENYVILGFVK